MPTDDLLAQGISAARAGRAAEAQATLLKVLEADDRSELAWLWLSGLLAAPDERRVCLENVLAINPDNAHARRGLALLERAGPTQDLQPAPRSVAPQPAPPVAPALNQPLAVPAPHERLPPSQPAPAPQPAPAAAAVITTPLTPPGPSAPATAETIQLASPASRSASAPQATLALPAEAAASDDAEEPCPYCGASTRISQRSCPACHKSLMARGSRSERRSVALTILVVLYALNSLGALAGGVLLIMSLVGMAAAASTLGLDMPAGPIIGAIVAVVLSVGLCLAMTLGLYRRRAWAYALHWVSMGFAALGTLALLAFSAVAGASLVDALGTLEPGGSGEAAGAIGATAGSIGLTIACNLAVLVAFLALTILSHRDFYGPMLRMTTAGLSNVGDPFNAGIAYRNRGMWYMAAHQWELAARADPRDVTVRCALGLAYAQLRRYAQARDALTAALAMAPGDPQLAGDLALVERLAAVK